jgi:hypothetical protein
MSDRVFYDQLDCSYDDGPHSEIGLAIAIDQHLPFSFATILCRRHDRIVVGLIWRLQHPLHPARIWILPFDRETNLRSYCNGFGGAISSAICRLNKLPDA